MSWSDPVIIAQMEEAASAASAAENQQPQEETMIGTPDELLGTVSAMAISGDPRSQAFGEIVLAVLRVRKCLNKASRDGDVGMVDQLLRGTIDALATSYASIVANQPRHTKDMVKQQFEATFGKALDGLVKNLNDAKSDNTEDWCR